MINYNARYTPGALRDELLNTPEGDAKELHSAMIVLAELVDRQGAEIEALKTLLRGLKEVLPNFMVKP